MRNTTVAFFDAYTFRELKERRDYWPRQRWELAGPIRYDPRIAHIAMSARGFLDQVHV